jgi:hypothetical protein
MRVVDGRGRGVPGGGILITIFISLFRILRSPYWGAGTASCTFRDRAAACPIGPSWVDWERSSLHGKGRENNNLPFILIALTHE